MRTVLVTLTLLIVTPILGTAILIGALFRVKDGPGSVYDWGPRLWSRALLAAAGAKVVLHNAERMAAGQPRVYIANHVSWFDVFTLAGILKQYKFVGKAELFRIPLFGAAARAAGMIPIERENRASAFESYRLAAERIRAGASVVVCPEGTRGSSYSLRPFKKGPFVLAIAAGVPIVPTVLYGTMHIQPRGRWQIRSGTVHVHFLEAIPSAGLSYEHRDQLSEECWERMAQALHQQYGVVSTPRRPRGGEVMIEKS